MYTANFEYAAMPQYGLRKTTFRDVPITEEHLTMIIDAMAHAHGVQRVTQHIYSHVASITFNDGSLITASKNWEV